MLPFLRGDAVVVPWIISRTKSSDVATPSQ